MSGRRLAPVLVALVAAVTAASAFAGGEQRVTELASVGSVSLDGPAPAFFQEVSRDGTRLFFVTDEGLVPEDVDQLADVYERTGGQTLLVSAPTGVVDDGTDIVNFGGINPDGTHVYFVTDAKLTADDQDMDLIDVYERFNGITTLVSKPNTGDPDPDGGTETPRYVGSSDDGAKVFFRTDQSLTGEDADLGVTDIYKREGGVTTLVSRATGTGSDANAGSLFSFDQLISADGSRSYFYTTASLDGADADLGKGDVYMREGTTTTWVSRPTGVTDSSPVAEDIFLDGVSRDGLLAFFTTKQQMAADDTDDVPDGTANRDVYQHNAGATTLLSVPTGVTDTEDADINIGDASRDGTKVTFSTTQQMTTDDTDDVPDTIPNRDVYLRAGGITTLVSTPTGVADAENVDSGSQGFLTQGGEHVLFRTPQQLVPEDQDLGKSDIYERIGGVTYLVTQPTGVTDPNSADINLFGGSVTADGERIFFSTTQKMTSDDGDSGLEDVYERSGGVTTLVSRPNGIPDPDSAGATVAYPQQDDANPTHFFFSTTQALVAGDGDGLQDVYEARLPEPEAPASGAGGPGGQEKDLTPPVVAGLRATPRTSRIGAALPRFQFARRVRTGTRISFRLSERARIRLTFAQQLRGRRARGRCRPPSRNRRGRPCKRFVTARPSLARDARLGTNSLRFYGRLNRRKTLRPGAYRLTITAVDAAGNRSKPRRLNLTFLQRARRR